MEREGNSDPIPIEIILEILSRLPNKSIARFGLVSKFCASILRSSDFTELFLTRTRTQPRLLFAVEDSGKWCFYLSPQPQNPDENHSLVLSADFHMQSPEDMGQDIFGPVSGLLYFPNKGTDKMPVICNPSTGQYKRLTRRWLQQEVLSNSRSSLGYDPIGKQYKVVATSKSRYDLENIVTLGTGKVSWRSLGCHVDYYHRSKGVCINGVLYYMVGHKIKSNVVKIASFDVRYEKLEFVYADHDLDIICRSSHAKMINYKGKLGVLRCFWERWSVLKLWLWVLEDVKKQEWLKLEYTLPGNNIIDQRDVSVVGVTATGEIILSTDYTSKLFFVYYFNPERNTLERVGIQGLEASENNRRRVYTFVRRRVYTFVDYAEDIKFI